MPRTPAKPVIQPPLQLAGSDLRALVLENRDAAAQRRLDYLTQHPDYLPCVVASCTGLVSPQFIRTTADGRRYGYCPRRAFHLRVEGQAFAI